MRRRNSIVGVHFSKRLHCVCVSIVWLALQLVNRFFQGFNATVLAYGQTASGKTFTLGNTLSIADLDESAGIIPRLLKVQYRYVGFYFQCTFAQVCKAAACRL